MDKYKETFETWNNVAKLYQQTFMDLDLYNNSYDYFSDSIINTSPRILEIGCGPGNITKYLLSKRPDFIIDAIDVAPNMVQLAKQNNPTATVFTMDARHIHELKTKYDAIVCGFCLPYLSKQDTITLIQDFIFLLHENAYIYLSFIEGDYSKSGYITGSTGDRAFFYFYNLNDLTEMFQQNNFSLVKIFHENYVKKDSSKETHTILILKNNN